MDNRGGRRRGAGRHESIVGPDASAVATLRVAGRDFPLSVVHRSEADSARASMPAVPVEEEAEDRHAELLRAIFRQRVGQIEVGIGQAGLGLDWTRPVLPQLSAAQQVAVAMSVRGHKRRMIAKVAQINSATLYEWVKAVWWPLALKEGIEELMVSPQHTLQSLVPSALQTYENLLKEDDRQVAQDVLDRVWGKPVVRVQAEETHDLNIHFVDMDEAPVDADG